jgi:hypothetical protein
METRGGGIYASTRTAVERVFIERLLSAPNTCEKIAFFRNNLFHAECVAAEINLMVIIRPTTILVSRTFRIVVPNSIS